MASGVLIKNPTSGMVKTGHVGYSWTYAFFGFFVPLFRGELGVAALHMLFSICTLGIWNIIISFLYNKQYMSRMLEQGWVLSDSAEKVAFAKIKLGIGSPSTNELSKENPKYLLDQAESLASRLPGQYVLACPKCHQIMPSDAYLCPRCGHFIPIKSNKSIPINIKKEILNEVAKDCTSNSIKLCKYCGEEIKAIAIKCKHCGSNLSE